LKGLMRRREFDGELQQEMAAHLELAAAENLRRGLPPQEARRLAAVRFGGVTSAQEAVRDERGLPGLASCLQDARLAGVTAQAVERRRKEIGIRMALGARPPSRAAANTLHSAVP
jgi:hypothetical protein